MLKGEGGLKALPSPFYPSPCASTKIDLQHSKHNSRTACAVAGARASFKQLLVLASSTGCFFMTPQFLPLQDKVLRSWPGMLTFFWGGVGEPSPLSLNSFSSPHSHCKYGSRVLVGWEEGQHLSFCFSPHKQLPLETNL